MQKYVQPDVLAERYATPEMTEYWSPIFKIQSERGLWVRAMQTQALLGVNIPFDAIGAYQSNIYNVDLASIAKRELVTRQDVKARIEEFNELASETLDRPVEYAHMGFTSRDLTDNVEQLQILLSMKLVRVRAAAVLARFKRRAIEFHLIDICERTHLVPAQTITLGKRFSNFAEDMLIAYSRINAIIETYPCRGFKGPTGTQTDLIALFNGDAKKALRFEEIMRDHLGFNTMLSSVGQVYHRSLDFEVVSALLQLASACGNFAKMIRLMAGLELAHEGFAEGQTGSSAMPHKMNSRTSERISGLTHVLGGFLDMVKALIGDQWFAGDVSCSVVRRVALPGAFFAIDGIFESTMTVLDEMEIFPAMIERERERYFPFLSTTRLLVEGVKAGKGRETIHRLIKKHSLAAIKEMRDGGEQTLLERLSGDFDYPFSLREIHTILELVDNGACDTQIESITDEIDTILAQFPTAVNYTPRPIL